MSSKNVEWANELLRYSIRVLQGKAFNARRDTILNHALDNKRILEEAGFWWQAERLDNWIHRFQRGEFTARRADPAGSGRVSSCVAGATGRTATKPTDHEVKLADFLKDRRRTS